MDIQALQKERVRRYIYLVNEIFDKNEMGKELLGLLQDDFLLMPVAPHNQAASYAHYREGQNDIIRRFLHFIDLGKTGELND